MSTEALLSEVRKLAVDQRIRFIEDVWQTIGEDDPNALLDDGLRAELDRRLEDLQANPAAGSPWEDVKQRILSKS
jgi:putative addiction module component (TIGR02574 family)